MEELIKEWNEKLLPWLFTHGLKVLLYAVGVLLINKIVERFIEKIVRIAVVPDRFLTKQAEKKREDTLIRIFTWTSRIIIWVIG